MKSRAVVPPLVSPAEHVNCHYWKTTATAATLTPQSLCPNNYQTLTHTHTHAYRSAHSHTPPPLATAIYIGSGNSGWMSERDEGCSQMEGTSLCTASPFISTHSTSLSQTDSVPRRYSDLRQCWCVRSQLRSGVVHEFQRW